MREDGLGGGGTPAPPVLLPVHNKHGFLSQHTFIVINSGWSKIHPIY